MAGDVVPGAPEERDWAEEQGFPALHFLAEPGGHAGVPLAARALAPAPAIHCVPLAIEEDLYLALALRAGALEVHREL